MSELSNYKIEWSQGWKLNPTLTVKSVPSVHDRTSKNWRWYGKKSLVIQAKRSFCTKCTSISIYIYIREKGGQTAQREELQGYSIVPDKGA